MCTKRWLPALLGTLWCTTSALGHVNLEFRPTQSDGTPGQVWQVGLYAVSDDQTNQMVRAVQVILEWDPQYLQLDQANPCINNGPYPWFMSGFFSDSGADGLNNTWTDGNAYYQAVGNFSSPAYATPVGLLITTFQFHLLMHTLGTELHTPSAAGQYTHTEVYGEQPGQNIIGTHGGATIKILDWGLLAVHLEDTNCCVKPGDILTVQLTAANLQAPINGVQACIGFDQNLLTVQSVTKGDGAGSPWDNAVEVYWDATDGRIVYAAGFISSGIQVDGVVATIEFMASPNGAVGPASIEVLPESPPLLSEFTLAVDATAIFPYLGASIQTGAIAEKADINGDGLRNGLDIQGYVDVLLSGDPTPAELCGADMSCDCTLTYDDLPLFAECLLTGQCACP